MVRKSVPARRRRLGSLLGTVGFGALVVATAAGCGSSGKTAGASGSSSVPVVTSTSAGAASASASSSPSSTGGATATATGGASASASNHPLIPTTGGIATTPKAQVSTVPAGAKLVAFDSAARSKDGMTLYLGIMSQGGACGQYDVVLQQNGGTVRVGLAHLPSGGRVCPMYVAHMLVEAKLSAPLTGGSVVDLANEQVVQAPVRS